MTSPVADSVDSITRNGYVYFVSLFVSLGGFLLGYDVGTISCVKTLPTFIAHFKLEAYGLAYSQGLVISVLISGCFFGSLLSGIICDLLGRKKSIFAGAILCVVGASVQICSINIYHLCLGRFVSGLGIGGLSMAVPLYQSEVSPKELRGRLISFLQLSIVIGILCSIWTVYMLKGISGNTEWQLSMGLQIAPSILLCLGVLFFPDSPKWLSVKSGEKETKIALSKLRTIQLPSQKIDIEYEEIRFATLIDKKNEIKSYFQLLQKPIQKSFALGVCIQMFQQLTGINLVMYYAPSIYSKLGNTTETTLLMQAISAVVNVLFTIPAVLFLDTWGRKPCLILGASLMSTSLAIVGITSKLYDSQFSKEINLENILASYVIIGCIYVFIAAYSFSWGPVAWIYPSELFPLEARSKAMSITTATNWLFNFAVTFSSPILMEKIGWTIYIIFCLFGLVMVFSVAVFYPETKGKSLEKIAADIAK